MPAELVNTSVSHLALSLNGCVRLPSEMLNVTSPSAPALGSTAEVSPDHHDHGDEKQQQKPQQQSCHCPSWSLRRPCQWIYRGEGNASIVLALPQERKIVRLAKIDNKLRGMDSDDQFVADGINGGIRTIGETLERLVFSQKILVPLLGPGLVRPCHVYHVDLDEIEEIGRALDNLRPAHRKHKQLAPVCHAIVCPDCTLLPAPSRALANGLNMSILPSVFCVELKPKQGFLSQGHQHCPFCLNQFLKRKHGKIQLLSQYCPLDLFSGCRVRMLRAIAALTRTPQNNLRIFQDGALVFAEECQTDLLSVLQRWFMSSCQSADPTLPLKSFCSLVVEALTIQLPSDNENVESTIQSKDRSVPVDLAAVMQERRDHHLPCQPPNANPLVQDSILSKLLKVQSLGDVDFGHLYGAYDTLVDRFHDGSQSYEKMRWTHPQMTADWLTATDEDDIRLVQRYRISSTTRDCSVMITFQHVNEKDAGGGGTSTLVDGRSVVLPVVRDDLSGHRYKCLVSVVDLDPKPVSCVDKHRRRNQAMNEAFLSATASHVSQSTPSSLAH